MKLLRIYSTLLMCTLCTSAQSLQDSASLGDRVVPIPSFVVTDGLSARLHEAADSWDTSMRGGFSGSRLSLKDLDGSLFRKEIAGLLPFRNRMLLPDSGVRDPDPLPFPGYHPDQTRLRLVPTVIIGSALALTITGVHIAFMNAWWQDQRGPFHVVEDNTYALNVDKAAHFWDGAFCSTAFRKSMEWCGFSRNVSVVAGAVLGAAFLTYVEFEDGFAANWGFSPGDTYANLGGAAWTVGQHYIPYMENFQPKVSYWPSKSFREGDSHRMMIDDYDGQTFWMGINVHGLLPCSWQKYWPSWLGFAVGVAVRGVDDGIGKQVRSIFLALDYDITKIIPRDTWLLDTLAKTLNYIHLPSPAIRISPGYIAYGLYF